MLYWVKVSSCIKVSFWLSVKSKVQSSLHIWSLSQPDISLIIFIILSLNYSRHTSFLIRHWYKEYFIDLWIPISRTVWYKHKSSFVLIWGHWDGFLPRHSPASIHHLFFSQWYSCGEAFSEHCTTAANSLLLTLTFPPTFFSSRALTNIIVDSLCLSFSVE